MRAPVGCVVIYPVDNAIYMPLVLISRQVKESPSLIIDSKKFMNQLVESVVSTMIYHRTVTPKM